MTKPERTRVYQSHHIDSTRWDAFRPRPDDVVVSTSLKSGTTWMQRILSLLIFQDRPLPDSLGRLSPWVDARFFMPAKEMLAQVEAQTHRRFLKSHLAFDALPYYEDAKYIYVGRDARDVFMSLWNHYGSYSPITIQMLNGGENCPAEPFETCPEDIRVFWRSWITRASFPWETDGFPYWSHFHHAETYWEHRRLPNLLVLHYNDLKADLEGEMRRVARFVGQEIPESLWPALVEQAGFAAMKRDAQKLLPELEFAFLGGAQTFVHKGTNDRWREVLTAEDLALYEAVARTLSPDLARWLEAGRAAMDPAAV